MKRIEVMIGQVVKEKINNKEIEYVVKEYKGLYSKQCISCMFKDNLICMKYNCIACSRLDNKYIIFVVKSNIKNFQYIFTEKEIKILQIGLKTIKDIGKESVLTPLNKHQIKDIDDLLLKIEKEIKNEIIS